MSELGTSRFSINVLWQNGVFDGGGNRVLCGEDRTLGKLDFTSWKPLEVDLLSLLPSVGTGRQERSGTSVTSRVVGEVGVKVAGRISRLAGVNSIVVLVESTVFGMVL